MISQERRQYIRSQVDWPVDILTTKGVMDGEIKNISSGGVYIQSRELPEAGETFNLRTQLDRENYNPLRASAEIVWSKVYESENFPLSHGFGVRFTQVYYNFELLFGDEETELQDSIENQRILILGATGLIGLPLARELAKKNRVIGVSRFKRVNRQTLAEQNIEPLEMDVSRASFDMLPKEIDYVFNETMLYDPSDFQMSMEVNAFTVARLMDRYDKCKGIVLGSTGSVYATSQKPMSEDSSLGANDVYSLSKICAEMFALHISRERNIPTCILRYYQPYSIDFGIISSLKKKITVGETFDHSREFYTPLFITDVVNFTIKAATFCSSPPTIINIGGEEGVSCERLVRMICEAMGKKPVSMCHTGDSSRPAEICDSTKRIRLLGKQKVSLKEGIRSVVEG